MSCSNCVASNAWLFGTESVEEHEDDFVSVGMKKKEI
jgi:hypothetical protein